MSDSSAMNSSSGSSRPVSWISVAAVFGCFALFLLLVYFIYLPARAKSTQVTPENVPQDQAWKTTADGRKAYLLELQAKQQKQLTSYAWIDQAKGVVQLPIDRAMELTLREINARKSGPAKKTSAGPR